MQGRGPRVAARPSDIAAFDLFSELLDQIGDALEMRMDGESATEYFERTFVVTELLQDHPETRHGPEVPRLARQHLLDIGKRAAVLLLHEVERGATIPGLDVIGLDLDDGVEKPDGEVDVLCLDRGFDAGHEQVCGIAPGCKPK